MALQIRRGTDADWEITKQNIIAGEPAVALDTGRFFVGTDDGEFAEFANVENYYDKNDVDDIEESLQDSINTKADASDTYTKAQVDTALNGKVDKVTGKGLSQNDFTNALKTKLDGVAAGAEVNVQSDWNEADNSKDDFIKNKPSVYTKSETDTALALKANAADVYEKSDVYTKTEIDTELEDYAKTDGFYEQMGVGLAENFVTNLTDTESEPFTFRTAGGQLEIGDREELKVVGGSIVFNQVADNAIAPTSRNGITVVRETDSFTMDGTVDSSGFSASGWFRLDTSDVDKLKNHKILVTHKLLSGTVSNANNVYYRAYSAQNNDNVYLNNSVISNVPSDAIRGFYVITVGTVLTNAKIRIQVFDLTQMFGSTIADYIYSLEQATAGAGVAFFKKYFPKDYYAYNTGELLHVKTSEFKTVGFNQWDEEWRNGYYQAANGNFIANANYICSKNMIPVFPSTTYYMNTNGNPLEIYEYDEDGNYLRQLWSAIIDSTFVTDADTHYLNIGSHNQMTAYNHDICINLHGDGTRDGEYEPYTEHSYPLDNSLTLRGIPKLDTDNNLYFDGDTYEHDGTVTRKYGIVDLSTLDWSGSFTTRYVSNIVVGMKPIPISTQYPNAIAQKYRVIRWADGLTDNHDGIAFSNTENTTVLYLYKDENTSPPSGYLVYELATPTTETADTFTNPQIVDNWGTEEFVVPTQSGVEIPVGHETIYPINLKDKVESSPNLPNGDGDYLLHMENGVATYKQLTSNFPSAPTENGSYVLKATVTNGVATLSWVAES